MISQQIKDVLQRLHSGGFPSAIVAGGAIRDSIFGKPIKDIDVFVSYEDVSKYMQPQSIFAYTLERYVDIEPWSYRVDIPDVHSVYSTVPLGGELPIQVIVMKPGLLPIQRVVQLDWGFCQACFNGEAIWTTCAFDNDRFSKTITLVHCENQHEFDRSMVRYERLKQKYPEFKLVIPEEFKQYTPEAHAKRDRVFLESLRCL